MNAAVSEGMTLPLRRGRMRLGPLCVAAEASALVQHRPMAMGQPGAFVEMAAGGRAQPVEMRLDMAKQRVRKMDTQQIRQRRIGTVEIHPRGIRREQSRLVD